jgi:hypothetical protein
MMPYCVASLVIRAKLDAFQGQKSTIDTTNHWNLNQLIKLWKDGGVGPLALPALGPNKVGLAMLNFSFHY